MAVKGGNAKPIMDIMPIVKSITKLDFYNQAMRKHGINHVVKTVF
ncbi:GrpB family protein [Virgibacillus sp. AGTR]|nr:GrpB family protein [Virgibacillus sp. AGTR]QRZ16300.1 GrpB family protein [Virgibacillus sp. AGTR]